MYLHVKEYSEKGSSFHDSIKSTQLDEVISMANHEYEISNKSISSFSTHTNLLIIKANILMPKKITHLLQLTF